MSEQRPRDNWEERLRDAAAAFEYPLTPDIAGAVRRRIVAQKNAPPRLPLFTRRRWAPAALALALILAGLLAVPEVRAGIRRILRLGAVEIVLPTATPHAPPTLEPSPAPTGSPAPTPRPTPTPLASLLDITGETDLETLQADLPFPVKLPTYPPDLGPPDRVFLQRFDGPVAVLVWLVAGTEDQVRFSLHLMSRDAFGQKFADSSTVVEETTVNGDRALWVRGPHMFRFYERRGPASGQGGRLVNGPVLIWQEDDITYRLEGPLSVVEAVRIAESVR